MFKSIDSLFVSIEPTMTIAIECFSLFQCWNSSYSTSEIREYWRNDSVRDWIRPELFDCHLYSDSRRRSINDETVMVERDTLSRINDLSTCTGESNRALTRSSLVELLQMHSIEMFRERSDQLSDDVLISTGQQLNRWIRVRWRWLLHCADEIIETVQVDGDRDRRKIHRCDTIQRISNMNHLMQRRLVLGRRKTNRKLRDRTESDHRHRSTWIFGVT